MAFVLKFTAVTPPPVILLLIRKATLLAATPAGAWLVKTVVPATAVVEIWLAGMSTPMSHLVVPKLQLAAPVESLSERVTLVPPPKTVPLAMPEVLAVVKVPKLTVLLPVVVEAGSPKLSTQVTAEIWPIKFS